VCLYAQSGLLFEFEFRISDPLIGEKEEERKEENSRGEEHIDFAFGFAFAFAY